MLIMLLAGKKAAVFGAGGKIGRAVSLAFAREGATVFLSGRRLENVEAVAADIRRAGGVAEAAEVDALDERAIDNYMEQLESRAGGVDVVLNAMDFQPVQGVPLADLSVFPGPFAMDFGRQFGSSPKASERQIAAMTAAMPSGSVA